MPIAPHVSAILIVGAGELGTRIARSFAAVVPTAPPRPVAALDAPSSRRANPGSACEPAQITTWTQSAASARRLAVEGFHAQAVDIRPFAGGGAGARVRGVGGARAGALPVDPAGYDVVYFCAAPASAPAAYATDAQAVYVDGYRRVLDTLAGCARPAGRATRLVLAGSTGVIGDQGGAAVDESVARDETSPRAKVLCACEDLIADFVRARSDVATAVILRLVGLYGPNRNPLAQLKAGAYRYPRNPEQGINLMHLSDAADALVRAGQIDLPPGTVEVIHGSDGQFPSRREYIEAICAAYDLPLPAVPTEDAVTDSAATAALRLVGDRRILNDKLRQRLLPELSFPSYREGLATFFC